MVVDKDVGFSVVIPFYNEEQNVSILHNELVKALSGYNCEIIYVNDGSLDNTLEELKKAAKEIFSGQIKIVNLSKNLGQSFAFRVGLDNANSKVIVFMDGDLQNDPKDIEKLLTKFFEGYDIVQGSRVSRKDSLFLKKIPSKIANIFLRILCGSKFRDSGCSLKVFSKEFIENFPFYKGFHRVLPFYFSLKGGRTAEVEVAHRKRSYGKSKYGLSRIGEVLFEIIKISFFEKRSSNFIYITVFLGMTLLALSFFIWFGVIAYSISTVVVLLSFILGLYLFVIAANLYIIRSFHDYYIEYNALNRAKLDVIKYEKNKNI